MASLQLCSHKLHKIENHYEPRHKNNRYINSYNRYRTDKEIKYFFTQQVVAKPSEIWVGGSEIRDPGSEIRDPRSKIRDRKLLNPDPDPEVKKSTGSRIRNYNTAEEYGMVVLDN
jgi:hypothetical protein